MHMQCSTLAIRCYTSRNEHSQNINEAQWCVKCYHYLLLIIMMMATAYNILMHLLKELRLNKQSV